jgi:opacity protein-like surface antigen
VKRFGLAIALMLVARVAMAQPAPWAPERLTPGWVFTPSMVLGVLHDSNVTLRAVNEPIRSEVVGLLNPRGELDFNGRHTHLNVGYSGALEAYRQLSALNRYEQRGRFEIRQQTGPRLELFSQATSEQVPTTERLDLGAGVLPFIGIGSEHLDVNGGFRGQVSPRLKIDGAFSAQTIRFDRELPTDPDQFYRYLRNGHSYSPSLGAMYSITQHVSVGASWSYRHAVVGEGQEVFDVQNTTGELAWQPAQRTTLRGGAGASYLTSDTASLKRWGPAYHLGLDHMQGRVSLSGKYEHAFVPSIGFGGLNANQRVSGSAHVPLAQGRFIVGGNVAYGVIEPVDLFGVDFTLHSLWTQGTVGYQVAPWLRAEAFVNRTHQTSTARGLVDRTRIGIEFVTAKPMRIQ